MTIRINTLSPEAQSTEIGIIFPKGLTFSSAAFGTDLQTIAISQFLPPDLFVKDELFGAFMVIDGTFQLYTAVVRLKNGVEVPISTLPGVWNPIIGSQIVSGTAPVITILAGQ